MQCFEIRGSRSCFVWSLVILFSNWPRLQFKKSLLSQCSSVKQGHQRDQRRCCPVFATLQSNRLLFPLLFLFHCLSCHSSSLLFLLFHPFGHLSVSFSTIFKHYPLSIFPSFLLPSLLAFLFLFITYSCRQVQWPTVFRPVSGFTHVHALIEWTHVTPKFDSPTYTTSKTQRRKQGMVAECVCVRVCGGGA